MYVLACAFSNWGGIRVRQHFRGRETVQKLSCLSPLTTRSLKPCRKIEVANLHSKDGASWKLSGVLGVGEGCYWMPVDPPTAPPKGKKTWMWALDKSQTRLLHYYYYYLKKNLPVKNGKRPIKARTGNLEVCMHLNETTHY